MIKKIKKISLLTIMLMFSVVMYAKTYTVYYKDSSGKERGIWYFFGNETGTFLKSSGKEGEYYKFVIETDKTETPGVVFAALKDEKKTDTIVSNDIDWTNTKDKRGTSGDGKNETLDKDTLYFFADKDVKVEFDVFNEINNSDSLSDNQKNKLKQNIENKNNTKEMNDFKDEIGNLNNLMKGAKTNLDALEESISQITDEEIKEAYNKKLNSFRETVSNEIKTDNVIQDTVNNALEFNAVALKAKDFVDAINNNNELNDNQKRVFLDKIKDVNNEDDMTKVQKDFSEIMDKLIEFKDKIIEAEKKLENLEDENEKKELQNKINEAKEKANSDDLNSNMLENAAKALEKAAEKSQQQDLLAKQKGEAIKEIKALKNLSDEEMENALANINLATKKDEIDKESNNAKQLDSKNLNEKRENVKNEISNLDLSEKQKQHFNSEIEKSKTIKDLDEISLTMNYINTSKKALKQEIEKIKKQAENLSEADKKKINDLIEKLEKQADETFDPEVIENAIIELKKEVSKIMVNLSDAKYTEVADAFYYINYDLFAKPKDNIYADVKYNRKDKNNLGGVTLGANYDFKDLGLTLGGFVEYDNNKAHHISLGTTVFYKDFSAFARYRLAILEVDKTLLNHNFDVLAKYSHKIKFDKLSVEPMLSIYTTFSSKVDIDEKVVLKPRVGVDLNLGTTFSYDATNNLNLFISPVITLAYNDQKLENKLTSEVKTITRPNFRYLINFGAKYEKDNFVISPSFRISEGLNFSLNLKVGYNF